MDSLSNETHWKSAFKAVGEHCLDEVVRKKEEILTQLEAEPYNIKEDQCNRIYYYMISTCLVVESYKVTKL